VTPRAIVLCVAVLSVAAPTLLGHAPAGAEGLDGVRVAQGTEAPATAPATEIVDAALERALRQKLNLPDGPIRETDLQAATGEWDL